MNLYGMWTLYLKEVKRFLKVYNQTLLAPMVNALLLLAVFNLAMGDRAQSFKSDITFAQFMVPGLIMMTVVQNAFANTSSSLIMGKVLGSVIDLLLPPLDGREVTFAMVMAGVTRGILAGLCVAVSVAFFAPVAIYNFGYFIFYLVFASSMLSLLGLLAGVLADSFDQMAAITSYIITPLSFLSGTFYSVERLPPFWQAVNHANPFFYMIDGFRYSMTGHHDGNMLAGVSMLLVTNLILYVIVERMITRGYRLKT